MSAFSNETVYRVLYQLGICLSHPVERADVSLDDLPREDGDLDPLVAVVSGARQVGIFLRETHETRPRDVIALIREGVPIVVAGDDGLLWVMESVGRKVEVTQVNDQTHQLTWRTGHARRMLSRQSDIRVLVAKKELECDSLSDSKNHGSDHDLDHHGHHTPPLRRFIALLKMDRRDIWTAVIFAAVSGILSLATPLAIESLVNVVSWGTYWQPLIVLAVMLLACLGLSGVLKVLQTLVVEIVQRRQLVRFVGDLAHRFPRANRVAIAGEHPRELANRLFDIMTIQKATAILMFDGISLVLNTTIGLLLLAFYHPFLLGFDLVLLIAMVGITWALGRGGVRTAIDESISKYEIVHWLQDVLAAPTAFKLNGGESLAVDRANRLASDYLHAREEQFRVVLRQVIFAISVQVLASTALLGLGGWLVIIGQLTLGQLVASELVVTVVVGAFAKAGKSLEKFYDLMAGIDKVGHLLDIEVDSWQEVSEVPDGPAEVRWDNLNFAGPTGRKISSSTVAAGNRIAIVGDDQHARSLLARTLAGLISPAHGVAEVAGMDAQQASLGGDGMVVGYAGPLEIFHGSIRDNVALGREGIGRNRTREVLQQVGIWERIVRTRDGIETKLQSGGYPLTDDEVIKLMIARAIAGMPRLLVIDGLLDRLNNDDREKIWTTLTAADAPWTLLVVSSNEDIIESCDDRVTIR